MFIPKSRVNLKSQNRVFLPFWSPPVYWKKNKNKGTLLQDSKFTTYQFHNYIYQLYGSCDQKCIFVLIVQMLPTALVGWFFSCWIILIGPKIFDENGTTNKEKAKYFSIVFLVHWGEHLDKRSNCFFGKNTDAVCFFDRNSFQELQLVFWLTSFS